jgi:hypothetical protein
MPDDPSQFLLTATPAEKLRYVAVHMHEATVHIRCTDLAEPGAHARLRMINESNHGAAGVLMSAMHGEPWERLFEGWLTHPVARKHLTDIRDDALRQFREGLGYAMARRQALERDGAVLVGRLLGDQDCDTVIALLAGIDGAGSRNLLAQPEFRELARILRGHAAIAPLLPADAVCVQCTLFAKTPETQWSVGAHQDLSIPVAHRVDAPGFTGWREKEGVLYVQPPVEVLEQLVAVRLQLDPDAAAAGPLEVVPGSHRERRSAADAATFAASTRVAVAPERGGAIVMRPLIVHASGKGDPALPRRVLHFVFAPARLPHGLEWAAAV